MTAPDDYRELGEAAWSWTLDQVRARVLTDGPDAPVADRPDQRWGVPARLRTVHVAP